MRHFISLLDFSSDEIRSILDCAVELKSEFKSGRRPPIMVNQVIGLLFQKPSLRTRVSFESLAAHLGASSLYLGEDVGWGQREPNRDFVPILTSYLDVLVIRAKRHADVEEAASYSRCPVINGLTDLNHPCQALADVLTVMECCSDPSTTKMSYVGDANNVARSLAIICSRLGIHFMIGAPEGYQFDERFISELDEQSTATIGQTSDPREAVDGASFVYTDVWTSMGQEAESAKRLQDLADFQVNEALMGLAANDARLLHCLPARRGEEVTEGVIDSPCSAVIEQAENRLHAQKGLVVWLMRQASQASV